METLIGFEKYWATKICLTTCSYFADCYTRILPQEFGAGFQQAVIVSRDGYSSCYFSLKDREQFGQFVIARFATDESSIRNFCQTLRMQADDLLEFVEKYSHDIGTPEVFASYIKRFNTYTGYHITPRHLVDFLPSSLLEKYLPHLEEARLSVEKVYVQTEECMQAFAQQVSRVVGYDSNLVLLCTQKEIENYFQVGHLPTAAELTSRQSATTILRSAQEERLFVGKEEADRIEQQINAVHLSQATSEIKGTIAFPGHVCGTARIVFKPEAATVFQRGDILITLMTRPDYLLLMEKAAAIVTDAGGVLCHAAITAREMKKPCVIGTKVATQLFKDGDQVEVDADSGFIRRIEI